MVKKKFLEDDWSNQKLNRFLSNQVLSKSENEKYVLYNGLFVYDYFSIRRTLVPIVKPQ